jgi:hypothetical protein
VMSRRLTGAATVSWHEPTAQQQVEA